MVLNLPGPMRRLYSMIWGLDPWSWFRSIPCAPRGSKSWRETLPIRQIGRIPGHCGCHLLGSCFDLGGSRRSSGRTPKADPCQRTGDETSHRSLQSASLSDGRRFPRVFRSDEKDLNENNPVSNEESSDPSADRRARISQQGFEEDRSRTNYRATGSEAIGSRTNIDRNPWRPAEHAVRNPIPRLRCLRRRMGLLRISKTRWSFP